MHPLLGATAFLSLVYGFWFIVRRYVLRTPVDNIPGPPSQSLFSGRRLRILGKLYEMLIDSMIGNMAQYFAKDNHVWLREYLDTYGPVAKLHGFFGVRSTLCTISYDTQ